MLFLRCLASRLTWGFWQQRIKESQEVFTLVRRWIFTGVKDLCMRLFFQEQRLLPLFLDNFLLQACLFALWPYICCLATFALALLQSLCPWSASNFRVVSTYSLSPVPIKYKYFLANFPATAWLVAISCSPLYSQVLVCFFPNPCCPVQAFKTASVYIHLFGTLHGWCWTPFPGSCAAFSVVVVAGRAQSTPICISHLGSVEPQAWPSLELVLQNIPPWSGLVQARSCWASFRCKAAV